MLQKLRLQKARSLLKKIIWAIVFTCLAVSSVQVLIVKTLGHASGSFGGYFLLALGSNLTIAALLIYAIKVLLIGARSFEGFIEKIQLMQEELEKNYHEHDLINKELNLLNKELNSINKELEKNVEIKTQIILEQRKRLEYASRMSSLGEMAGGIAHEINNPLMIIKTALFHLRKSLLEKGKGEERSSVYLEKIDNTIERISRIIQGLLAISVDATNESFSSFKLQDIIDDVLSLIGEKLKIQKMELRYDHKSADLDHLLYGNRTVYTQVFFNVLNFYADRLSLKENSWIGLDFTTKDKKLSVKITDSENSSSIELQKGMNATLAVLQDLEGDFYFENAEGHEQLVLVFSLAFDRTLKLMPGLSVR